MADLPNVPIDKDTHAYMPTNEDEVKSLVQYALNQKITLRCKASGHAWPPGIASGRATFEEGFEGDPNALYQVPTLKTGQVNVRLDNMKNNKIVQVTREEADTIGLDWDYTWKGLNEPCKDVLVHGGLFKIGGGLVLGSNEIDGGSITIKNGAVYNLDSNDYALFDIGGIYSQTVAGYLSTGAAGGSTTESIERNIVAYKIVTYDEHKKATTKIFRKTGGAGKAASLEEVKTFHAYATSMGLLGVTLEVYVRGIPRFAIVGYEVTTKLCDCEVDLFGNGFNDQGKRKQYSFEYKKHGKEFKMSGPQLSMEEYLKQTKYTRLEWWPQTGVNRVVLWKADKIEIPKQGEKYPQQKLGNNVTVPVPESVHFEGADTELIYPTPYQNGFLGTRGGFFNGGSGNGQATVLEVLSSLLLIIIGNLNNLANVEIKWTIDVEFDKSWFEEFEEQTINILMTALKSGPVAGIVAGLLIELVKVIVNRDGLGLQPLIEIGRVLKTIEPLLVMGLYNEFAAQLSNEGGPQQFTDIWFEGLPMDKDVNYAIIPVVFTELWFPINRSTEVMKIVETVFSKDIKTLFAIEFYAGAKSNSWLSASGPWPDSVDEGDGTVLRVDVYYFPYNAEPGVDPKNLVSNGKQFYSKIWNDIKSRCAKNKNSAGELNPIPFKFHLGKYAGDIGKTDQYRKQYKKWDDWHKKREDMDPDSIFTNNYWSDKLRINHDTNDQIRKCCWF